MKIAKIPKLKYESESEEDEEDGTASDEEVSDGPTNKSIINYVNGDENKDESEDEDEAEDEDEDEADTEGEADKQLEPKDNEEPQDESADEYEDDEDFSQDENKLPTAPIISVRKSLTIASKKNKKNLGKKPELATSVASTATGTIPKVIPTHILTERNEVAKASTQYMVDNAIKKLDDRTGSSLRAICNYIEANHRNINIQSTRRFIKKYLVNALISGKVIKMKGVGLQGSFKLSVKYDEKEKLEKKKLLKTLAKQAEKKKAKMSKKTVEAKKDKTKEDKITKSKIKLTKEQPNPKKVQAMAAATAKPATAAVDVKKPISKKKANEQVATKNTEADIEEATEQPKTKGKRNGNTGTTLVKHQKGAGKKAASTAATNADETEVLPVAAMVETGRRTKKK